ncbi:TolC family protein [Psychrobacter sp. I-STPA10]|uniref:TolC family protein n=1 Tax=Psychrobacter sp. I-STPA10 TaxID=2585769 RepID=UPI001E3CF592|nr:TolC family protein [Psychrobacter sp. I-STPA10]
MNLLLFQTKALQFLPRSCGVIFVYLTLYVHAHAAATDIQINSLITQAIQTHPLVGSAKAEQQATTEGITAAKLGLLPAPSFSSGYNQKKNLVSQVRIRQSLWTGGQLTANVNQAIFDDKAAIEHIYEQQNQVAKTTIEAWQSYITAVEKQRVYFENLKQLHDFEAMMQRRVTQGVSARIELDLVTNRILQEQNAYQAALEQQNIAAARLEQITGQNISQDSAISVPKLELLTAQVKQQSANFKQMAFNQASFYNPTVVKEYYQVESAKQEVKAQRAKRYPTVYMQYEYTYDHHEHEGDGELSLGLNYDPGAGLSNLALARASQAHVESIRQSHEAARRTVMEDIQVQYQQFASAKDRELSLVAASAGAQIVVNSYRRQFIAGRKTWLEVLNAVREYSDYQIQLVQTRADILAAYYKLQVDFGMMPWQQFAHNRQPVPLFSVTDSVNEWLSEKNLPSSGASSVTQEDYSQQMAQPLVEPKLLPNQAFPSPDANTNTHININDSVDHRGVISDSVEISVTPIDAPVYLPTTSQDKDESIH